MLIDIRHPIGTECAQLILTTTTTTTTTAAHHNKLPLTTVMFKTIDETFFYYRNQTHTFTHYVKYVFLMTAANETVEMPNIITLFLEHTCTP